MLKITNKQLGQYVLVAIIILCFCALVIPYINRAPLIDEVDTLVNFTDSWVNALFFYARPNNHFIHSFFVWVSRSFIGSSLLSLRLPTFFSAVISLALVYRFGKRLSGHSVGFMAMTLFAICISAADYAVNARGYTIVNILTILLVWQLLFIKKPPFSRSDNYKLMGIGFALMMVMPSTLLLLFGATIWLGGYFLLALRDGERSKAWAYAKLAFSMLFGIPLAIPFYSFIFFNLDLYKTYSGNFGYPSMLALLRGWFDLIFWVSPYMGLIFIGFIAVGLGVLVRQKRWRWLLLVGIIFLAAFIAGIIQLWLTDNIFYPRNYLYLVPLLALVGGFAVQAISQRAVVPVMAFALVLLALVPLQQHLGVDNSTDTVRELIYDTLTEEDLLIVGCCYELQMRYYTQQDPTRLFDLMDYTDSKQSVVLLGTNHASIDDLITRYRLIELNLITGLDSCISIDNDVWATGQFVRCPIVRPPPT